MSTYGHTLSTTPMDTSYKHASMMTPPIPRSQDLTTLNTLRLTSYASRFVCVETVVDLQWLSDYITSTRQRIQVLGGGSNVILDEHLASLIVHPVMKGIKVLEERATYTAIQAQAGESWHELVCFCLERGWGGLENLALIPGSVGAAPVQNIGAYGVELGEFVHEIQVWDVSDRSFITVSAAECAFGYRCSRFKRYDPGRWVITSLTLHLPRTWEPRLDYGNLREEVLHCADTESTVRPQHILEAVCKLRTKKLPDVTKMANAGSFFKNPVVNREAFCHLHQQLPDLKAYPQANGDYKLAAGWLIDQCGWKGYRKGAVGIHHRHALVLVNYGGARATDLLSLAKQIQDTVALRYNVSLEVEPDHFF